MQMRGLQQERPSSLELGNIGSAVRAITSDSSYVVPGTESYEALLTKHPSVPLDRRPPPPITIGPVFCTAQQGLKAPKFFSPGSAPGLDSLRPLHIQVMVPMSSPDGLPAALVDFINLVLAGGLPPPVRHVFFGASICALRKRDGCISPIAVGLTLRRLASKIANRWAMEYLWPELAPRQMG